MDGEAGMHGEYEESRENSVEWLNHSLGEDKSELEGLHGTLFPPSLSHANFFCFVLFCFLQLSPKRHTLKV